MGALLLAEFFIAFFCFADATLQGSVTTETQFVEGCDSLRLARLYTYCAVPFYVDVYDTDVPENQACTHVRGFQMCTDRAGKTAQCIGHQYILKSTLRYFTSVMLETYTKYCNITDHPRDAALSPPEIIVVIHGKRAYGGARDQRRQHWLGGHRRVSYDHPGKIFYTSGPSEENNRSKAAQGDIPPATVSLPENTTGDELFGSRFESKTEGSIGRHQNKTHDTDALGKGFQEDSHSPEGNPLPTDIELWTTTPTAGRGRRLMQGQTTCGPQFPTSFTYPGECKKKTFLRRFFTCGIAFQHNFDARKDPCDCYFSYRRCVEKAKHDLKCLAVPMDEDPLMISVKVLMDLMTTMYDVHCIENITDTNITSARARALPDDCCNQQLGLKKAIMCYATYFYLSDTTTPALWPNTHGTCSLVTDLQRCVLFTQQRTQCTECRIGRHVNKFVGTVIRSHHEECLTNISSMSVQSLGPYTKQDCRHTQVFKRALTCAIGFQDMIELESTEDTSETVLCGHASRLHICLEDSVEGTNCAGDTHISSQLKMYKKVIEDEYKIHCNVLIKRERLLVNVRQRKHSAFRGASRRPRDILVYDNYEADVQQTSNVKTRFAGPRYTIRRENEDDADYERFKSKAIDLQRSAVDTEGGKEAMFKWDMERQVGQPDRQPNEENLIKDFREWRLLKQEKAVVPDVGRNVLHDNPVQEASGQLGVGGGSPKLESSRVIANPKGSNDKGALSPVAKSVLLAGLTGRALRHVHIGKAATGKRDYEEEYFGNEDPEHVERVPEEAMLQESGPILRVPSGQEAQDILPCSEEKLQFSLRQCEANLLNAISMWPRFTEGNEEFINVESGRSAICDGVLKLQTCLLDALISSHCNRPQIFNDILAEFNKRISLSICAAEWSGLDTRNGPLNGSLAENASLALNASQALQQSHVPQASGASQCSPELALLSLYAFVSQMRSIK